MIPIDQTLFGDGSDGTEPGNCFAACIASLLEVPLSKVPNFCANPEDSWWRGLQSWLRDRGLYAVDMTWGEGDEKHIPEAVWSTEYVGVGALLIATGPASRGHLHAVVVRATETGPELLHDPHPSREGLLGVSCLTLLVPLDPSRCFIYMEDSAK